MSPGPGWLFVYGTLKRGEEQEGLAGPGRRVAATVRGQLFTTRAGPPAMTLGGDGVVHGELVELTDPRALVMLDRYEGVSEGLYRRVEVDADVGLRRVASWAWVMDDPRLHGGRPIPSGSWASGRWSGKR